MLDFAIFAVTFLLALVGAVLYLYPVTAVSALGGPSCLLSVCLSRIQIALVAAGRRGAGLRVGFPLLLPPARGQRSAVVTDAAPCARDTRADASGAGSRPRLGPGAGGRAAQVAWAPAPESRGKARAAAGGLGAVPRGPASPRPASPCHCSRESLKYFGWLVGRNSAEYKFHFLVFLGGNSRVLHPFLLSRDSLSIFLCRLPFHLSSELSLPESKVLKALTGS